MATEEKSEDPLRPPVWTAGMPFPDIKSKHSLVHKYVTPELWEKFKDVKTKGGCTLLQCIACAVAFDNQHCGIYAADGDCYETFGEVFNPVVADYHTGSPNGLDGKTHVTNMNVGDLNGNINTEKIGDALLSTRIRVGRSIEGYGLSAGITREDRLRVEEIAKAAFAKLEGDLAGTYYPLLGMNEEVRQQLVDDHFLFVSGDPNLKVGGLERDWPEGRGIYHNADKTFLIWVGEEDQFRIISMQKGGDVKAVFERLTRGIAAVEAVIREETKNDEFPNGRAFMHSDKLGYFHSCPTNLGTGMRASVHINLAGFSKEDLKEVCADLRLQPRGTRGESGGQTGTVWDISNKHRLGYSEVELVQTMIDGVNRLYEMNVNRLVQQGKLQAQ